MSPARKIFLFVAIPLLVIFAAVAYFSMRDGSSTASTSTQSEDSSGDSTAKSSTSDCSQIAAPVDLTLVKGILYPGQYRGGHYKAHGGFGFQGQTTNDVTVKAPIAATVTQGSRYIEQGEIQYMFDFKTSCGLEYRLDHLKTLTSKFQAAADQLPAAQVDDSRTSSIKNVTVTTGETIATAVGFEKGVGGSGGPNVSFDFGVYDKTKKNTASQDAAWAAEHKAEQGQAYYAVCWFDLLSPSDETTVRALPAVDATSGSKSDYCK